MDDFQSLRKKYNSFDWEFYSSNYFDDEKNKLSLKKDDCWWHYLTIGLKENFLYFDINDSKEREKEAEDFDWESYSENYNLDKNVFSTKYHVLWHWVNIGKINGFLYFSLKNQYEINKQKNNFDIEFYNKKYNFLNISNAKCWWHFINFGSKLGYLYFNKLDSNNSITKQNTSLVYRNNYYKQFENNILIFISSLSINSTKLKTEKYYYEIINNIINYNYNYNLYLVKYDKILNKITHLNEFEYNNLIENQIIPNSIFYFTDFKKMEYYYQKIKNNSNNIYLFNLNIFPMDILNLENIQALLNNHYKCGFYNGNLYLEKLRDNSLLLKKFYVFVSKLNNIISSSPFYINELISYFKKYNISIPVHIVNINLPIIQSNISLKEELDMEDNSFIIVFAKLNNQLINFLLSMKDIINQYQGHQVLICLEDNYKDIILYKKLIYSINKKIKIIESENCYKFIKKSYLCLFYNLNINIFNKLKYCLSNGKYCLCNSNNFVNSLIENTNIKYIDFEKVDLFNAYIKSLENIKIDYSSNKFITWPNYINKVLSYINKNQINKEPNKKIINNRIFIFIEQNSTFHLYTFFLKLLIKLCLEHNIELGFVHWNIEKEIIEKIQEKEIISLFKNTNDNSFYNKNINIDSIKDENSVLLFIDNLSLEYNIKISNYINNFNIKSIFIYYNYYDFNDLENTDYRSFLFLNLLSSFKIITSDFVQKKLSFLLSNYSFSFQFPLQKTIELPYCEIVDKNDDPVNTIKNIDQSINIFIPQINNIEIVINFLNIIFNSPIKNKIKILICKENEELLRQYYKLFNSLYFISKPKQIDKEFTKSINYCFIENNSLENNLLINNYLYFNVPIIYYSANINHKEDKKGCIMENNLKIDNFDLVNKVSDKNFYNKLIDDLKYTKMQNWEDYTQIVFKEIIYL